MEQENKQTNEDDASSSNSPTTTNEVQANEGASVTEELSSRVPKPPKASTHDTNSNSKSDLDKTAEMLRLRRITMQKHESLINQLNTDDTNDVSNNQNEGHGEPTPISHTSDKTELSQDENISEPVEEDSYSPRIIW